MAISPILTYLRAGLDEPVVADSATPTTLELSSLGSRTIKLTGTLTAARSVILGCADGADYVVENATTGGYAVTVKQSTSDTGVTLSASERRTLVRVGAAIVLASYPQANLTGTFASMPSAGVAGRVYYATDAPTAAWFDDGAAWRPLIGGKVLGTRPPLASAWTSYNVGAATLTDVSGGLLATGVSDAAITLRGWEIALSSSTAYAEACFEGLGGNSVTAGHTSEFGVMMRESGTGKVAILFVAWNHNGYLCSYVRDTWTSPTARGLNVLQSFPQIGDAPTFMRLERSGSNLLYKVSRDRVSWQTLVTDALTTPFTTAPDRVGIVTLGLNVQPIANVPHFRYGSA